MAIAKKGENMPLDIVKILRDNYDRDQAEIQNILDSVEGDLGSKFDLLFQHQMDNGFIQDDLSMVNRWTIWEENRSRDGNEKHPLRMFLAQYNPRRAERFKGAGRKNPPAGVASINNGCFLCPENIWWQQRCLEMGYKFKVGENDYHAWCNPFPLLRSHLTISSGIHEPQKLIMDRNDGNLERTQRIVNDLLTIVSKAPKYIGFYNGLGAGATIPTHLHFQFFKRPEGQAIYPLEWTAKQTIKINDNVMAPFLVENYPITCIYFNGNREEVCNQVVKCIAIWIERCGNSPNLSANIIATLDHAKTSEMDRNTYCLYLIPRDIYSSLSPGRRGVVGGLEVLGEIVFSETKEFDLFESGKINYQYAWQILKAVEARTISEVLRQISKTLFFKS